LNHCASLNAADEQQRVEWYSGLVVQALLAVNEGKRKRKNKVRAM